MAITIQTLREAGFSEAEIKRVRHAEQAEAAEKILLQREQARIRKQKQRARHAVTRDMRDSHVTKRDRRNLVWLEDWQPNEAHYAIGSERRLSLRQVDTEADKYRDWNRNAKTPHKDPNAGFRNWLRSPMQNGHGGNGNGRQRSLLDTLEGTLDNREIDYEPGTGKPRPLRMDSGSSAPRIRQLPKG